MQRTIIFDFSRVLLFPKDKTYTGSLNEMHRTLSEKIDYHLLDYFSLNDELLKHLSKLKPKYRLFIFTSETIQDDSSLQPFLLPLFKNIFSASKLGIDKKEPLSYETLAKMIGLEPKDIIYIDDNLDNIRAAQKAGVKCIHYENNAKLLAKLPS